mmetsp:Transcript_10905/g.23515  ORF Transcript_10905/g.23515 Transcript_10905/m.23515 type:complete len:80 (+) Transcript_10905:1713-1952(+)
MDPLTSQKAREALVVVEQISNILDTGLDKDTLAILVGLLEAGANPESLASVVRELRREAAALATVQQQKLQQAAVAPSH